MKKTSKIFGAAALTAALALGTAVPAFAVENSGSVEAGGHHAYNGQAATGDTTVKMKTENTQIDVAVPLSLSFYAKSSGGDLTAPSAGTYTIDNYSSAPVYITNSKVEYSTGTGTADNANGKNWRVSDDIKANAQGLPPEATTTPAYGDVTINASYKKISSASTDPTTAQEKNVKLAVGNAIDGIGSGDVIYIAKSTDGTTASSFGIDFTGYSSILKKTDENASDVIKITYTVSTSSAITEADTGDGKGELDQTV